MHELAITRSVVDMVAERTGGRRVSVVRMRVGALTCVVPDALRFCFEVAAEGTPVAGAELCVEEVPGRLACRSCGSVGDVVDGLRLCGCGSGDVEVISGEELVVVSVEMPAGARQATAGEDACA